MSRLVMALPSKGRLQDNAAAFFARAGLALTHNGGREYRGGVEGLPGVEVSYLSAGEIAGQLASGQAHLGVTGEDLIREAIPNAEGKVALLAPLGFGAADVVVAAPRAWIDVRTMSDLEDVAADFHARHGRRMRVATKYVNLTRSFFAAHGVSDYRIVESLGATEGAPASGAAELIVDITSTGATLAANGLKPLSDGVILRSQANLVASRLADWSAEARSAARQVFARIAAEEGARLTRDVRGALPEVSAPPPDRFGAALTSDGAYRCPAAHAADLAAWLVENGAGDASVARVEYVFTARNALDERLSEALGG